VPPHDARYGYKPLYLQMHHRFQVIVYVGVAICIGNLLIHAQLSLIAMQNSEDSVTDPKRMLTYATNLLLWSVRLTRICFVVLINTVAFYFKIQILFVLFSLPCVRPFVTPDELQDSVDVGGKVHLSMSCQAMRKRILTRSQIHIMQAKHFAA
jgi:succinate-acetate transporter protein